MKSFKISTIAVSALIALAGISEVLATWSFSSYSAPQSGYDQYWGAAGLENGTGPNGGSKGWFFNGAFPGVARLTYYYSDGIYSSNGSHDTRSNSSATVNFWDERQVWDVSTYVKGYSEVSNSEGNAWGLAQQ